MHELTTTATPLALDILKAQVLAMAVEDIESDPRATPRQRAEAWREYLAARRDLDFYASLHAKGAR